MFKLKLVKKIDVLQNSASHHLAVKGDIIIKDKVYEYYVEGFDEKGQMIVTGLGFNKDLDNTPHIWRHGGDYKIYCSTTLG